MNSPRTPFPVWPSFLVFAAATLFAAGCADRVTVMQRDSTGRFHKVGTFAAEEHWKRIEAERIEAEVAGKPPEAGKPDWREYWQSSYANIRRHPGPPPWKPTEFKTADAMVAWIEQHRIARGLPPYDGDAAHKAAAAPETPEPWDFTFDSPRWSVADQGANRTEAIREYVVTGQTVENWTELVTSFYAAGRIDPRTFYEAYRRGLAQDCSSLRVSIIEESADTIFFEWQHDGCQGFPAQHELRRITRGPHGMFMLSYVEKTRQLTAEKRNTWIALLKAAKLRPEK